MQVGYDNPGVLYPENKKDLNELMANMRSTHADFKVLSIHGGREAQVRLESWQQESYHAMLAQGDLDLIIGHHPHRVRPVEKIGEKVIFYSLGNYMMLGASALNNLPTAHNYGLMGRLYLKRDRISDRLKINFMEAIPLYNMQSQVSPLTGVYAQSRIENLNDLSLQELGSTAVQWSIGADGWGRACVSDQCALSDFNDHLK
jgi:poly-gamma-glutamate synthesis protein (capsule biosynthesis protein)